MPSDPYCGEIVATVLCPDDPDHPRRTISHHCTRATCEVCWPTWRARAVDRIVSALEGYQEATGTKLSPRHVSLHPPEDQIPAGLTQMERMAWINQATIENLPRGIDAAVMLLHPYRLTDQEHEATALEIAEEQGTDRYRAALSQDNWQEFLDFSPHAHLMAFGFLEPVRDYFKRTGWTYRMHGARSGEDLRKTVSYLLGHSWVRGNHKAARHLRGLSTRRLSCEITREKVRETCTVCDCPLVRIPEAQDFQDLHNAPGAWRIVEIRHYHLRGAGRGPPILASGER